MKCPWCGTATAFLPATIRDDKAFLPEASTPTRRVLGPAVVSAVVETNYRSGYANYAVVVCQQCDKYFVALKVYSEWRPVYPYASEPVCGDVPGPLRGLLAEAQLCLAVKAHVGCLLVCRTLLIAIQRDKDASNLKGLVEAGLISASLCRQADEIRLWANVLAHEDVPSEVTDEDCEQLVGYIVALTNAIYVEPERLARLQKKRTASTKTNSQPK